VGDRITSVPLFTEHYMVLVPTSILKKYFDTEQRSSILSAPMQPMDTPAHLVK
jgi:hypothetical protein